MTYPTQEEIYDLIGIGIGPFNLGLAAMLSKTPEIRALFLEQKSQFNWHPGLLLEGTTLQVPFFADLVTMADPTSPYSFLNYLHVQRRLYHFYFLEHFQIPRQEYNHYCQWVAQQLPSCCFGQQVVQVEQKGSRQQSYFQVTTRIGETDESRVYYAKHLVLGVGSVPYVAQPFREWIGEDIFHTGEFLRHQKHCQQARSVSVIGSGQSAAEVFYQLLLEQEQWEYELNWLTRSDGFFPMEYSKLGLEHFSPDYIRYFHHLTPQQRQERLRQQALLYKGISVETIAAIYNLLYERTIGGKEIPVRLYSQMEVQNITRKDSHYLLHGTHREQQQPFVIKSERVVMGTGYEHAVPSCVQGLSELIQWDEQQRYVVQEDYRLALTEEMASKIFVQNGEMHTHGVGAPDLGLGAHRNAVIINTLAEREVYPVAERNVFQQFGVSPAAVPLEGVSK